MNTTPARTLNPIGTNSRPALTRTSSGNLKQTKLSDLFARQSASPPASSPPPPSFSQGSPKYAPGQTSTPCCSSVADDAQDIHIDLNSTDTEPDEALTYIYSDCHSNKRARVDSPVAGHASRQAASPSSGSSNALPAKPLTRRLGFMKNNKKAQHFYPALNSVMDPLSMHTSVAARPATTSRVSNASLDRTAYLSSYSSHEVDDQYSVASRQWDRDVATPFVCAYANSAKQGRSSTLAVATEEGTINLLDTSKSHMEGYASRTTFQAHNNAIFDIKWSRDDGLLATSSGDQSIGIHDVQTGQALAKLTGHLCTTKSVQWDPFNPNIIASGSRDGSIRIWDIRASQVPMNGEVQVEDLNLIQNAHELPLRRSTRSRTAIRSVTSVVFDTNKPNHLFSSGSADGVVKQWDLRRSMHRRVNPPAAAVSPDFGLARSKVARSHGITSMALAPDGATLYALSISNRIFALDALNIANPEPVRVFSAASKDSPHRVTDVCRLPSFRADSFYVRLALSCNENGRYIMAGSSDGSIWMWDTLSKDSMSETSLPGYRAEVSGLDTAWEQIAACSDDTSTRIWRPNI